MRVGLVSPYSWTYPGGVTRHVEALASELRAAGHDVLVLAPFDPDDALSARLHRGAFPARREVPEGFVGLGRTVGIPANGAVSNVAVTPHAVSTLRRELTAFAPEVVHVQEPVVPAVAWDVLCSTRAPLVGTFHTYSTNRLGQVGAATVLGGRRRMNHLRVRIAVSEAAAWTGRRFYGGRYRVIPNGVHLVGDPPRGPRVPGEELHIVFVGQAVERKGLPLLLRAFEALREQVPARLTVVGATEREVAPVLHDARGVAVLGGVDDATKHAALREADVLCAPSLGGESFGMVLTEAFAAGIPVVASAIAGYTDVVRDGVDGMLVPPGDATALARVLRGLALDEPRRHALAGAAADAAGRFAWPRVAEEVVQAYEDAVAIPEPQGAVRRAAVRIGALPADGGPPVPPRRMPPIVPVRAGVAAAVVDGERGGVGPPRGAATGPARSPIATARRLGLAVGALGALLLAALALSRIGVDEIGASLLASSPPWVLAGFGLMAASMLLRAVSWRAVLRAALPGVRVRHRDAFQGTAIGVLMSATLPARLGEPSRAVIVARRLGRMRERLPVVLGTIVSQTMLNLLALAILGVAMLSTVEVFTGNRGMILAALGPAVVVLGLLAAPWLLGRRHQRGPAGPRGPGGRSRARSHRHEALRRSAGAVLVRMREGLRVFSQPRLGATAAGAQLSAWALQWLSCYLLLVALGLDQDAGMGAAAAVLFAVNVTAALPATPSNVGVFQFACVLVLGIYGVGQADALAYGIVLQAVEVATAVALGAPALVKEGLSWREVRLRALHASPVQLDPLPGRA